MIDMASICGLSDYSITKAGIVLRKGVQVLGSLDKDGYRIVGINVGGKRRTLKVHRLVAQAFVENPNALPEVNHVNGIKADNRAENLQWITHADNMRHAAKNGLIKNWNRDVPHLNAINFKKRKLDFAQAQTIRVRHASGESFCALGRDFGIDPKAVSQIVKGITYKAKYQAELAIAKAKS